MADEGRPGHVGVAGDRDAQRHLRCAARAVEHALESGEEHREQRLVVGGGGRAEGIDGGGVDASCLPLGGVGLPRRAWSIGREVGDRIRGCQRRLPVALRCRPALVVVVVGDQREIVDELHRLGEWIVAGHPVGGRSLVCAVESAELLDDDTARPAIADDVVHGEEQQVVGRAESGDGGSDQGPGREVEGGVDLPPTELDQLRVAARLVEAGEVDERHVDVEGRRDPLLAAIGRDRRAERGVAGDHGGDAPAEGVDVERARELDGVREVVRPVGVVAEPGREPDLLLARRERRGRRAGVTAGRGVVDIVRAGRGRRAAYRTREEPGALHGVDRTPVGGGEVDEVGVGVGGRQERPTALGDVDALVSQVEVEEAGKPVRLVEPGEEQRAKVLDRQRSADGPKVLVELAGERGGPIAERRLQLGAGGREMGERRSGGGEGDRMAHERASEPGHVGGGQRIVAVLPRPAVERIHVVATAGDDPDREPATDHLPVGGDVGSHAEQGLGPAGVAAESGDHLVEDECGARPLRERPEAVEELDGLERRVATLHRFDEHGGQIGPERLDRSQRLVGAVVEHDQLVGHAGGDAGGDRYRPALTVHGHPPGEHLVEQPVVVVGERDHLRPPGHGSRHSQRGEHGLRAGVAERDALGAGHRRDERRHLAGERRLGADLEPEGELFGDRVDDERRRVAEEVHPEAHRDVEVLVAVDIPDLRSGRAGGDDRVDELLPREAEPRHGAGIGEVRSVLGGRTLRSG